MANPSHEQSPMARPASPFNQTLSHLDRITSSSLPLCGASSLRDEINNLILVNLRIISSSAQAKDLSIKNLINIAHIRGRLQRLNMPVAQLDEVLKRRIDDLGRNLAVDSSIGNFERLIELRELLAYNVGFDCGTLEELITKVVHELEAIAEWRCQVRPACHLRVEGLRILMASATVPAHSRQGCPGLPIPSNPRNTPAVSGSEPE